MTATSLSLSLCVLAELCSLTVADFSLSCFVIAGFEL